MNDADIIRGLAQELLEWKAQATRATIELRRTAEALKKAEEKLQKLSESPAEPAQPSD